MNLIRFKEQRRLETTKKFIANINKKKQMIMNEHDTILQSILNEQACFKLNQDVLEIIKSINYIIGEPVSPKNSWFEIITSETGEDKRPVEKKHNINRDDFIRSLKKWLFECGEFRYVYEESKAFHRKVNSL